MEDNQNKAPNPFTRDILFELAKLIVGIGLVFLFRKYRFFDRSVIFKLCGFTAAWMCGMGLIGCLKSIANFVNYRSYVKEFRGGRPMARDDYLKEQAMINRTMRQDPPRRK